MAEDIIKIPRHLKPERKAYMKRYRRLYKDVANIKRRERYAKDPNYRQRVLAKGKVYRDTHKQQIAKRDFIRKGRLGAGSCAICGLSVAKLFQDHCHRTGMLRQGLCSHCNFMLGFALDNPTILRKGADYLERFR